MCDNLTSFFQFFEYVGKDGVAVELRGYAHEMSTGVVAPGYLVGEYGAVYQLGCDPVWVDEVSGCGEVPDFFCPGVVVFVVAANGFGEEVAYGAFARDMGFEFGQCGEEVRGDIATGDLDEGYATVEDDARGEDVLSQVKFEGVCPTVFVPAEPDDDDVFDDFGFEEDGGGYVGDGADGCDVERIIGCHGSVDEVAHGVVVLRCVWLCEIVCGAAKYEVVVGDVEAVEETEDFVVASFHAVARSAGALVVKGRGIDGFNRDFLGG